MVELAAAVRAAGEASGGLVDATLVDTIEALGIRDDAAPPQSRSTGGMTGDLAATEPATSSPARAWASISVDRTAGTVTRPVGVRIDSGGLVKGLLADVLCGWLAGYADVVVDACGDARFAGTATGTRAVEVAHPFGGMAAELEVGDGAVATSGTTRRRWRGADGSLTHHLLDPATRRPARTGLCQVTALAPSALEAEVLAKWALLSGPGSAPSRLPHGGVIIDDDGAVQTVQPVAVRLPRAAARAHAS